MERVTHPLIIVGHLAVLRCVYAYLLDIAVAEVPYLVLNLNTLIRLDPAAYGCKEKRVKISQRDVDEESEPIDLEAESADLTEPEAIRGSEEWE
jgi:broad specificity phosphatase PhoE